MAYVVAAIYHTRGIAMPEAAIWRLAGVRRRAMAMQAERRVAEENAISVEGADMSLGEKPRKIAQLVACWRGDDMSRPMTHGGWLGVARHL